MNALLSPRRIGAARMLFAEEFDLAPGVTIIEAPAEPEIIAPVFTAADVDAARDAGWSEGREAGLAEAEAASAAIAREAIAAIAAQLGNAAEVAARIAEQAAEEIARLLLDALMTLLPALCARHGEAEVRDVLRAVLPPLTREASITVRVSPLIAAPVQDEIARLDPDLAERVRLVPTDTMAAGDVRVAWNDGAAMRDTGAVWNEVAAVLSGLGLLVSDIAPAWSKLPVHDDAKESAGV
jgi:flagellar assembly protein FliH